MSETLTRMMETIAMAQLVPKQMKQAIALIEHPSEEELERRRSVLYSGGTPNWPPGRFKIAMKQVRWGSLSVREAYEVLHEAYKAVGEELH